MRKTFRLYDQKDTEPNEYLVSAAEDWRSIKVH
jgi:hypothetical protein